MGEGITPRDYEILYDLPGGEYDGRQVEGIRTTTIRAGASLEIMCCPIVQVTPAARRELRSRKTRPAVERINRRNTERHMMRLIEMNFTPAAFVLTGTYDYPAADYGMVSRDELLAQIEARGLPEGVDGARRDVRNFLARVRRRVIRSSGDASGLKWLYRIEESANAEPFPRYHFHMVIEAPGMTQDEIKALWPFGFTSCDRLDLKHDGAARLASYLNKQRRGGRWWAHSRNLKAPVPTVSERRISRRRAAAIAADVHRDGARILEALYPGYRCMAEPEVRFSDFMPGAYIYARMRR